MIRSILINLYRLSTAGLLKYLALATAASAALFLAASIATAYGFQATDPYILRWSLQLLFVAIVASVVVVAGMLPAAFRKSKQDRCLARSRK